jgi:hypothetical protein
MYWGQQIREEVNSRPTNASVPVQGGTLMAATIIKALNENKTG